ncbi:MAG TPA: hypothetical protein VLC49_08830 [Solirubrobacteraceae bacterium]|nr:hypothetical protein [Solirubrobacteraceae bacterium]
MKRSLLALAGAVALGVALPAAAGATTVELGVSTTPLVAPSCPKGVSPSQCTIILTRATALETIRDNVAYPSTVKQAGRLVAFTVGLSALSSNPTTAQNDVAFLDKTYGGDAQVQVTVLKRVGPKNHWTWQVVESSPLVDVQPYLGQIAQFPLTTSLPVVRGETIALTTPTWAPVLSIDLSTDHFAYRQSRSRNCNNPPSSTQAQVTVGMSAKYACDYPGTRVEYSATEITTPVPNATTTPPTKKKTTRKTTRK